MNIEHISSTHKYTQVLAYNAITSKQIDFFAHLVNLFGNKIKYIIAHHSFIINIH